MSVLLSSTFNAASNRTRLAAAIGASADFVTEFNYDNLQRMTGIQQHGVSGGNAVADKRIDLAYNAAGQFSAISRFANLAGTQAVATSDFVYDGAGRLIALTHAQGTNTLADYTWSFDAGNRLTQFTSLHDGIADYSYEDRGQLTGSQYDYQGDESYSYDANGNRTNTGYSTGDNNRLLSDGVYTYQYDAEGNRTKKTEIASGEATEYHWDHRNRLVSVVHLDALGVPIQTVDYVYDLFDRRIGKSDTPAGGPSEAEVYVYDGAHVALRFIDGQLANRYLHGPAIDQILADEQVDSLSSPGEVLWPLTDHLGTVRDLAAYDDGTDTTSVVNHIAYDAFGRVTAQSNAAVDHLFGYTGREWDSAVDLQYNRARWYDPATGRWLSEDPIGFAAGDANLERYVGNRATVSTDPSGFEECPFGAPVWDPSSSLYPPRTPRPTPLSPWDGPSISQAPEQNTETWQEIAIRNGYSIWEIMLVDILRPGGGFDQTISVIGTYTPGSPITTAGGANTGGVRPNGGGLSGFRPSPPRRPTVPSSSPLGGAHICFDA